MPLLLRILVCSAAAVVLASPWLPSSSHAGGTGPGVALIGPGTHPEVGDTLGVSVIGVNLPSLGAYEVIVSFDATKLEFVSGGDEGFLGSTGRNVSCFPPILATGEARFGCATSGSGAGPSGDGTLATLYFEALAPGDVEIALRDAGLADEFGDSAGTAALRGTMITVQGEGGGPSATNTPVAQPTKAESPTPEFTPAFVPPVETPTVAGPASTRTAVPTATNTSTPGTPSTVDATSSSGAAPTAPGGSIAGDDPTPSSNVRGSSSSPAGIVLPSTGSAGLR